MEYKSHNLLILENMHYGNATYIFEGSFEENRFRYLTKKDILDQNLHINRIIHDSSWQQDIESYFK